jgi:hypothetical protein
MTAKPFGSPDNTGAHPHGPCGAGSRDPGWRPRTRPEQRTVGEESGGCGESKLLADDFKFYTLEPDVRRTQTRRKGR